MPDITIHACRQPPRCHATSNNRMVFRLFSQFECHHILHMMSVWEHIYRLHLHHAIFHVEHSQVARLSGWIAAYIHYALGL